MKNDANSTKVFWGCFTALITTSLAFSTRIGLVYGPWSEEFALNGVQEGALFGAGVWPFAISIILFSLVIDKIGYKSAMYFSFACYAIYGLCAVLAYGTEDKGAAYNLLYMGSIILGLGNGTVEAFINPVVATIFSHEKTKRLNFLHAGWPTGLVLGGVIMTALGAMFPDYNWLILVAVVILPSILFVFMLAKVTFPVNERVAGGASYRDMLAEFGVVCAFIAALLICSQMQQVIPGWGQVTTWVVTIALTAAFGFYARSFGRPLMIIMVLIMIPLAITELGTDSWITALMTEPLTNEGIDPIWVLVYTSVIMIFLRFNVGPIVKALTPLGLLAISSVLAIIGLFLLSNASGLLFIFIAATVYGLGKSYFWPTMLGTVAEQCPRGGALTLNAIAGIGMLAVGILGGPLIGYFQETKILDAITENDPALAESLTTHQTFILGEYDSISPERLAELPAETQAVLDPLIDEATQSALARITIFPMIMLVGYIGLLLYFKSKGGYRPQTLADH